MNDNNDIGGAPTALSLILIQFLGWLNRENTLNYHKIFVEPMLLGGLLPATLQYRMLVKNKYLGLVYALLQHSLFPAYLSRSHLLSSRNHIKVLKSSLKCHYKARGTRTTEGVCLASK